MTLVDVAFSLIADDTPRVISPPAEAQMKMILGQFVSGSLTLLDCKRALSQSANTARAVDRIHAILNTSDDPLPPAAAFGRRNWTDVEDNRLLCAIHRFGLQRWTTAAAFVGNSRTRAQCAQRWMRGLDPRLARGDWSREEDVRLIKFVMHFDADGWTTVSQLMKTRSDVQ
jgi:hypothetical protein